LSNSTPGEDGGVTPEGLLEGCIHKEEEDEERDYQDLKGFHIMETVSK
jgi:hypothetical protein